MDSLTQDIVMAVDIWLGKLNVTENKNIVLANMKRRIHRTMSQVQFEGIYSLLEVERLQCITDTWTNILDLLQCGKTEENQKILVKKVLELFDHGEISLLLTNELIVNIFKE